MNNQFNIKRIHNSTTNQSDSIVCSSQSCKKRRTTATITADGRVVPIENAWTIFDKDIMGCLFNRMLADGSIMAYACLNKLSNNAVYDFLMTLTIQLSNINNKLTPFNNLYDFLHNSSIPNTSIALYIFSCNIIRNTTSAETYRSIFLEFKALFDHLFKNYTETWIRNKFDINHLTNENDQIIAILGSKTYTLDCTNSISRFISIKLINTYISNSQIIKNYIEKDSAYKNSVITLIKLAKYNQSPKAYNLIIKTLLKNICGYYYRYNTSAIQLLTQLCEENLIDTNYANSQIRKMFQKIAHKWAHNSYNLHHNEDFTAVFAQLDHVLFKLDCDDKHSKDISLILINEYITSRSIFNHFANLNQEEASSKLIPNLFAQAKSNQSIEDYNRKIETLIRNAKEEFIYNRDSYPFDLLSQLASEKLLGDDYFTLIQELIIVVFQHNESTWIEKYIILSILFLNPIHMHSLSKNYFNHLKPYLLSTLKDTIENKETADPADNHAFNIMLGTKEFVFSIIEYHLCHNKDSLYLLEPEQYDELRKLSIQCLNEAWPNRNIFIYTKIIDFILSNKLSKINEKEIVMLKSKIIEELLSEKISENLFNILTLLTSFVEKNLFTFKKNETDQIKQSLINLITTTPPPDSSINFILINTLKSLLEKNIIEINTVDFYKLKENLFITVDNSNYYYWGIGDLITTLLQNNLITLTTTMESELITSITNAIYQNDKKLNQQQCLNLFYSLKKHFENSTNEQLNWSALDSFKNEMFEILRTNSNIQEKHNALRVLDWLQFELSPHETQRFKAYKVVYRQ